VQSLLGGHCSASGNLFLPAIFILDDDPRGPAFQNLFGRLLYI
jgi:hypothetical protein